MSLQPSIREQALRAIIAALASAGTPASGGVFRSRLNQLDSTSLPCYDVSPGEMKMEDPGEFGDRFSVTHTLPVSVRAIVNAATQQGQDNPGATIVPVDDSSLDPFYVFAVQQLIGLDGTLGGLVNNLAESGAATVFQPEGRDIIGLDMTFELIFATKRGDPTQKG